MASTFKYHSQVDEVVPWQATYTFPTQATKVNKQTVKLVPKNGSSFSSGNIVRIEFPADNYLNVLNSVLQFDVQWNVTNANQGGVFSGQHTGSVGASTNCYTFVTADTATAGFAAAGNLYLPTADTYNSYRGFTMAVTNANGTFYTIIGSSFCNYTSSGTLRQYTFQFLTPLPAPVAQNDYITLIPPYHLQRGGSQNFIKRLRILYGSLVLEDILEYKTLVRIFYESGVDPSLAAGSNAILEGTSAGRPFEAIPNQTLSEANALWVADSTATNSAGDVMSNQAAACGVLPNAFISQLQCAPAISSTGTVAALGTAASNGNTGRYTYCMNLMSGIFTQKKLIPLKWMAAQLAIEITLSTEADCALVGASPDGTIAGTSITYQWSNVNFIAEMLEFDSAYDQSFFEGLRAGGVPIKFDTFHYHSFSLSGAYNVIQIHERARSVKAAYAVVRDTSTLTTAFDSDKFFFNLKESWTTSTGVVTNAGQGQITQFQWRIGGRYYPAQPVRTIYGAAEALIELQKALDTLGDYTRSNSIVPRRWSTNNGGLPHSFIMAAGFENQDVFPDTISGINAEEQSDIALFLTSTTGQEPSSKRLEVFMHYDCLMIVRDGNVVDLVL
jgi:hypothetical protein